MFQAVFMNFRLQLFPFL